jgi:hypothetical protein
MAPAEVRPVQTVRSDETKIMAVIDTNVLLEMVSIHDLARAAQAGDLEKQRSRSLRAGAALRLAIYLNERGAFTCC